MPPVTVVATVMAGYLAVSSGYPYDIALPWLLVGAMALGFAGQASPMAGMLLGALGVLAASQAAAASGGAAALVVLATVCLQRGPRWAVPALSGLRLSALVLVGAGTGEATPALVLAVAPLLYGGVLGLLAVADYWRDRRPALLTLGMLGAAVVALVLTAGWSGLAALPFAVLFAWVAVPHALWAASDPRVASIQAALAAARVSVIVLSAAIAAGSAGLCAGLVVLALVPAAAILKRILPHHT